MIASRETLPEPDPFLEQEQSDRLVSMLEKFPQPKANDDGSPLSAEYLEGFEEFRRFAIALVCWATINAG